MKLTTNNGKLVYNDKFSTNNTIHVFHDGETIEDIKEDVYEPYLVAEECTQFARTHLITAPNEDEALQKVDEYLREKEGQTETHIICVFKLEI